MASCKCRRSSEVYRKEIEEGRLMVEYASCGDFDNLKSCVDAGFQINADAYKKSLFYQSLNYWTPLQSAARNGHVACVSLLIENKADLDAKDRFDITALHMAAQYGHTQCLKLLLEAGASCNIPSKYSKHGSYPTAIPFVGGTTALHLATASNNLDCIRELIMYGADYNAVDELGQTSMYIASDLGYEKALLIHLHNAVGKDILSLPVKGTERTPLHECVRLGMHKGCAELLRHGSDANCLDNAGHSPLHLAVQLSENFSFEMVKEIVTKGFNTDVDLPDRTGYTALQYVCFHGNARHDRRPLVAAFLIAYGASFQHVRSKHGQTLLKAELRGVYSDNTLLLAIVRSLRKLPSLESMGLTHPLPKPTSQRCQWYRSIASNPRTLQHSCRCVVRERLGKQGLRKTDALPLPTTLKNYLLLENDELS